MSGDLKRGFNRVMISGNKDSNIIIEGKEYFISKINPVMTMKHDAIYMNEDSTDLRDLEHTIESILIKIDEEISEREKEVLISVLTSFFSRNTSLEEIQQSKVFYFYEHPIRLIQADDSDDSESGSYVVYENDEALLSQVLAFVIQYGLSRVLYEQADDFPFERLANKLLNTLNINEQLCNHVFTFQLKPTTKDKVLINTKYVDIVETENLLSRNKEAVSGLYTYTKQEKNIQYEENMNDLYKMQIIIHELLHAVIDINGIDFVEMAQRHENNKKMVEEEFVQIMGYALGTFIMDNPEFVQHLHSNHAIANIPTEEEIIKLREYSEVKSVLRFLAQDEAEAEEALAKVKLEIMLHDYELEKLKRKSEKVEGEKKR